VQDIRVWPREEVDAAKGARLAPNATDSKLTKKQKANETETETETKRGTRTLRKTEAVRKKRGTLKKKCIKLPKILTPKR